MRGVEVLFTSTPSSRLVIEIEIQNLKATSKNVIPAKAGI